MNKKGIQLSINFIVVTILALTVFSMGMYLLYRAVGAGTEIKDVIDQQHQQEIESMLVAGERVAIPFNRAELKRKQYYVFGLGLLNVIDNAAGQSDFRVTLTHGTAADPQNNPLPNTQSKISLPFTSKTYTIIKNEQEIISIPIKVLGPATKGTYTVNVDIECVTGCGTPAITDYDRTKKIYITVI